MLKWCPRAFSDEARSGGSSQVDQPAFEAGLASGAPTATPVQAAGQAFEKDTRLTGGSSLWDLMSETEKESLLDAARADLQAEFQARENELRKNHRRELDGVRKELETRLDNWSREYEAGNIHDRQQRAVEAAGLAVALARKIIRDTAHVDQDMVVRTLETALYKAQTSHPLTAVLHPEDAEFLLQNPGLMTRLRIAEVVPDRRMEKGGARIRAGSREWDAGLSRQVDTLAGIIEETLAAGEADLVSSPGEHDDPGLE